MRSAWHRTDAFAGEMRRFLPADVHARTLGPPTFRSGALAELERVFASVRTAPEA